MFRETEEAFDHGGQNILISVCGNGAIMPTRSNRRPGDQKKMSFSCSPGLLFDLGSEGARQWQSAKSGESLT
jgi:hypothetical protein